MEPFDEDEFSTNIPVKKPIWTVLVGDEPVDNNAIVELIHKFVDTRDWRIFVVCKSFDADMHYLRRFVEYMPPGSEIHETSTGLVIKHN